MNTQEREIDQPSHEINQLSDDELDAVAGGKAAGGKPTMGKLNFEHYFDVSGT
jgi:hypothetical protein